MTAPLAPGTRLGPYVLRHPLGTGGTATVYVAEDEAGNRRAVKVRRTGVSALDRRFLREFESMRTLRIPGVVRVHEAGVSDELLWFSMDLVEGVPLLDAVLAVRSVEARVPLVADVGRQLLDVLGALHQAGYVHRDVKPSNVLVDADKKVHVLDFGIVRFFGDHDTLSDSGQILGTVPFMAPEQLAGLPSDHRIDLFAAGVMLYEAIDGPRPRPQTAVGWIPRICLERLVPLACKHAEVPRALSHVVEELCAVDPADRPDATAAAQRLRKLHAEIQGGAPAPGGWPEPPFVDTGDWWADLEGCIGNAKLPPVQILEGPSGSGRRRIAEQIARQAVMQGIWPIAVACRVQHIGGPVEGLLERLLAATEDDDRAREFVADDADVLRRMWPHLPLPGSSVAGEAPSVGEVAEAAARVVGRFAEKRPLLVVVRELEQVDELTARALTRLAGQAGPSLGLLVLHESRWESSLSRQVVAGLRGRFRAGFRVMPPLASSASRELAAALVPKGTPPTIAPANPQRAVEAGLEALAAWRGERWTPPDASLWPLAVRDPLPEAVFDRLAGRGGRENPWVVRRDGMVTLAGEQARRAARARLADLRGAASALETGWVAEVGAEADPEEIATLRLLAGDPTGAWAPSIRAAVAAEANGRYADARRWLLVIDTLPENTSGSASLRFELAVVRARVALRTEAGAPRLSLVEACERLATGPEEEALVKVLRAEYQLRAGEVRPALVAALRVASPIANPPPHTAVRALLVATHARFVLGQFADAGPQLERARALLRERPEPRFAVQVANWESELLWRDNDLQSCRKLLQDTIRLAGETGYLRGVAFAASRLGQVLRLLGKRREAEHQTRAAREAFQLTSDLVLDAETALELAILRAERGDAAGARHLLDEAIRRIRGLRLDPLLPRAMRVALQIATLRGDPTEASVALPGVDGQADPEAPAALIRWWRTRGDVEQALAVRPPPSSGYGDVLWRVERGRAALVGKQEDLARREAEAALGDARKLGFAELATYAQLLLGVVRRTSEAEWRAVASVAASSLCTEVYLGAVEMEARRLAAAGDAEAARSHWRVLRARAEELGYRPGVEEAIGWLQDPSSPLT